MSVPQVLEYSGEDGQYSVCQYLAEPGISAVTSFIVGAESYLAVFSTKLNELVVYLVTHQVRRYGGRGERGGRERERERERGREEREREEREGERENQNMTVGI